MKQKKSTIVIFVLVIWLILVCFITIPWIHKFDRSDYFLSILAHLSALIWWIVLFWAFHHLAFQIVALFKKVQASTIKTNTDYPSMAILYVTCNDFSVDSCLSCINQNYPNFRLLICDDSTLTSYQKKIDKFYKENHSDCELVRRIDKQKYKAGNLNHAIEKYVSEEWILLVDSDQILSSDYLSNLVNRLPNKSSDIAFVQAAHEALLNENSTFFENALAPEVYLYYGRDMSVRETYGFVPLLGHGALIKRSSWEKLGGFPERVSEDFAFALRATLNKQRGIYIEDVVSQEAVPKHFNAFMVRLKKFASGTAELFRTEIIPFLKGPSSLVEKWDFLISLSWYVLMPLVTLNGFLAAYVVHRLWSEEFPYLHAVYAYLYIGLILVILAIHTSVAQNETKIFRFYFWCTAIYASAMPIAGLKFLKHLLPFYPAIFERTPKGEGEENLRKIDIIFMIILGLSAISLSLIWISPFSPFLAGQGFAYIFYPLYGLLCSSSLTGRLSRILIYIPGLLMLLAIYTMWEWGRF